MEESAATARPIGADDRRPLRGRSRGGFASGIVAIAGIFIPGPLHAAGRDLVVQRRGGTVQLAKGLPLALANRIEKMQGVKEVIRGLMDMVAFEKQGLFMVIVNGWEADCPVLDRVQVTAGRRLQAGDRRKVMLGRILAANLGKRPGDVVEIYSQQFEVVGIFDSFSVYESGAVFMLMEELQQQMDRRGQATGFVVQVTPPGDARVIEHVRRDIEALDPAIAATPCAEFVRSLKQMQVTRTMSWVASVIAVLIGAVGVLNTMAMSVLERRPEIGAFRAMGWRKRQVAQLIVTESLFLAAGAPHWDACWGCQFSANSLTYARRPGWFKVTGRSRL